MRGEHRGWEGGGVMDDGSSPRARGTLRRPPRSQLRARVIPACAGNTIAWQPVATAVPGHPRVRGEHFEVMPSQVPDSGSSPRARGTLGWVERDGHPWRVIPACAGNTLAAGIVLLCFTGSSPRARGTLHRLGRVHHRGRVIPACAGNTPGPAPPATHRPGHPRVRGEHVHRNVCRPACGRVIPACAGNTGRRS